MNKKEKTSYNKKIDKSIQILYDRISLLRFIISEFEKLRK